MWFILRGSDSRLYPPNMTTLSSEILVNEKLQHGGGVLPVTMGLDQYPADKHNSLVSSYEATILQVFIGMIIRNNSANVSQ